MLRTSLIQPFQPNTTSNPGLFLFIDNDLFIPNELYRARHNTKAADITVNRCIVLVFEIRRRTEEAGYYFLRRIIKLLKCNCRNRTFSKGADLKYTFFLIFQISYSVELAKSMYLQELHIVHSAIIVSKSSIIIALLLITALEGGTIDIFSGF
jgi:hypothetical protein